jgi:hypothetical protein
MFRQLVVLVSIISMATAQSSPGDPTALTPPSTYTVTLSDATNRRGQVLVTDAAGKKGTICANNSWTGSLSVDGRTASVICNQAAIASTYCGLMLPRFGGAGTAIIQGLKCQDTGSANISECESLAPSNAVCSSDLNVGVVCPLSQPSAAGTEPPLTGTVATVYFYTPTQFVERDVTLAQATKVIISDIISYFAGNAELASLQLSLSKEAYQNLFTGPGWNESNVDNWHAVNFFFFDSVEGQPYARRSDLEYWITQLSYMSYSWIPAFSASDDLVVLSMKVTSNVNCVMFTQTNPGPPPGFQPSGSNTPPPNILPTNTSGWKFRLINGRSASSGTVLAQPPGTTQWGTLCGATFDTTLIESICTTLGYPPIKDGPDPIWFPPVRSVSDMWPIYGVGPYACPKDFSNFSACSFTSYTTTGAPGICTHRDDLSVDCQPPASYPSRQFVAFSTLPSRMNFFLRFLIASRLGISIRRIETLESVGYNVASPDNGTVSAFRFVDAAYSPGMSGSGTPGSGFPPHFNGSGFPHFSGSGFPPNFNGSGFPHFSGSGFPPHFNGSGFPHFSGSGFPPHFNGSGFPPGPASPSTWESSSGKDEHAHSPLSLMLNDLSSNTIAAIFANLHPEMWANMGIMELRDNTTMPNGIATTDSSKWIWKLDASDFSGVSVPNGKGFGRVILQPGTAAALGTVCSTGTTQAFGNVVCERLVGASASPAMLIPYYRPGSGIIYVSNATGVAPSSLNWSNGTYKNNTCFHMEDLGLMCGVGLRPNVASGTRYIAVVEERRFSTPNDTVNCLATVSNTPRARFVISGYSNDDPQQVLVYFSLVQSAVATDLTTGDIEMLMNATNGAAYNHFCAIQIILSSLEPVPTNILTQNPTAPPTTKIPTTARPSLAPPVVTTPSVKPSGSPPIPTTARPSLAPGATAVPPVPTTALPSLAPGATAVPPVPTTARPSLAPGATAVPPVPTTALPSLAPGATAVPPVPTTALPSLAPGATAVPPAPTTALPSLAPGATAVPTTALPPSFAPGATAVPPVPTTVVPTPQPTAPPTQVRFNMQNSSAINETAFLSTLASLLGVNRTSLSIASKTSNAIVVQFANSTTASQAASNATVADLKQIFPTITGAAAVSSPPPAAESSSKTGMIIGVVIGAVVLAAVVAFVVKSRGSKGTGSGDYEESYGGKDGIVELDQLFLNDDPRANRV